MSFNPSLIAQAPLAVQIHLATVIPAFFIGSWLIFFSTKGARFHRGMGVAFLSLMAVTALTTLFIRVIDPGRLSWIHPVYPAHAVRHMANDRQPAPGQCKGSSQFDAGFVFRRAVDSRRLHFRSRPADARDLL